MVEKLSQFTPAISPPALTDYVASASPGPPNLRYTLAQLGAALGITLATSNLTFYVSTSGNDSNSGLSPGTPFLTIQHALNVACCGYNWQNLYTPTIQIVTGGTFSTGTAITFPPILNSLQLNFNGDISHTPGSTVAIADSFIFALDPGQIVNFAGAFTLSNNFPLQIFSGILNLTSALQGHNSDTIFFTGTSVRPILIQNISGQLGPTPGGVNINFWTFDLTGVGGLRYFVNASGGFLVNVESWIDFPTTPITLSNAFLVGSQAAWLRWHSRPFRWTNTANVLGNRVNVQENCNINTFYGVTSDIPGTVDGIVDNSVTWQGDQLSPILCDSSFQNINEFPAAGTQAAGDVLNGCFLIAKDRTNGQRWLAFNEAASPDVFNTPGTVYAKQICSTPNTQTGASYTLVRTDTDGIVEMNNAGANTLTVPPNSSVPFNIGDQISVVQAGAGVTTIAAGVGVTVRNVGAIAGGQWKSALLYKRGTDEWVQINGAF